MPSSTIKKVLRRFGASMLMLGLMTITLVIASSVIRIRSSGAIELRVLSDVVTVALGTSGFNELAVLADEIDIFQPRVISPNEFVPGNGGELIIKRTGRLPLTLIIEAFGASAANDPGHLSVTLRHLAGADKLFDISVQPEGQGANDGARQSALSLKVFSRDDAYSVSDGPRQVPKINGPLKIQVATTGVRFGLAEKELAIGSFDVSGLSFVDLIDPFAPAPVAANTIKRGSLTVGFAEKKRVLSAAENLTLGEARGKITAVRMSGEGIETVFSGTVRGLTSSLSDLFFRPDVSLVATVIGAMGTLIGALLSWLNEEAF
jgi:hypothetical protein